MMKKILIVDDDNVTRTIVKTVLGSEFIVTEADNSVTARDKLEGLDLIICDYHMPGMNGIEFAMSIQEKNIPFFMLTVENNPDEREKSKKLGVRGWLTKPFAPNFLLEKVRKILE